MDSSDHTTVLAPFVIGVTGNMDPYGYFDDPNVHGSQAEFDALTVLKEKIHAVFKWIIADAGSLDPHTCQFHQESCSDRGHEDCWAPLGLEDTPITVLSSLAPGIDTLVAEIALDLADQGFAIRVSAPLPFLADIYLKSSTFNPSNATDEIKGAKRARYLALCDRIRSQRDFVEARDLFPVRLVDEEHAEQGSPCDSANSGKSTLYARMERDLTATQDGTLFPHRYLRYRAAGEYVANYSQLLLGIWDSTSDRPNPDNLFAAGSATIAEAKRNGMSFQLLPVSSSFAWADNGPVLHLPIARRSNSKTADYESDRVSLLQPYDCRPPRRHGESDEDWNERWNTEGNAVFRRIVDRHREFNTSPTDNAEHVEIFKMLAGSERSLAEELTDRGLAFVVEQRGTAGMRRRVANIANYKLSPIRKQLLKRLVWCVAIAGFALATAEHWHPQNAHADHGTKESITFLTHDWAHGTIAGLLLVSLSALVISGFLYHRHLKAQIERKRHDYRALAEGLRVQVYWNLAGLGRSVAANYMQRQRGELDWIRNAVSSLNSPYSQWKDGFSQLEGEAKLGVLRSICAGWTKVQANYFLNKASELLGKLHFWHTFAWGLGAGAVIHLFLKIFYELFPLVTYLFKMGYALWPISILLLILGSPVLSLPFFMTLHHLVGRFDKWRSTMDKAPAEATPQLEIRFREWIAKHPPHHPHKDEETEVRHRLIAWIFVRKSVWRTGFVVAALTLPLPFVGAGLAEWLPGFNDLWIICIGTLLLGSALSLAWAERNLYSEHSRQFRCMHQLYDSANRRLDRLIQRLSQSVALRRSPGIEKLQNSFEEADHRLHKARIEQVNPSDISRLKAERSDAQTRLSEALDHNRILGEIHDILYNLGCEALDENAEWLILHRSRPLEPFVMG